MKNVLEWLIGLENIRLARDAPLLLRWDFPVPAWLLLTVILLTGLATALLYWREPVSGFRKTCLALVRMAIAALLLAVLCRPSLVLQRNRVEPAYVALLADTSLSMAQVDALEAAPSPQEGSGSRLDGSLALPPARSGGPDVASPGVRRERIPASRLDIVRASILGDDQAALRTLLGHNGVQLVAFAASAEVVGLTPKGESPEGMAAALRGLSADGVASNLSAALDLVLRRSQGRRVAGIVLASDGRLTSTAGLEELLREAADRQVPIYPLAIGSSAKQVDLEVFSVKAQSVVFAGDVLLMEAQVAGTGIAEPLACTVQLRDENTGEVKDEKSIVLEDSQSAVRVELSAKPVREGPVRYQVRVLPAPGETFVDNNQDTVNTLVVTDKLNVLYVEGYPRFEYRYLKNALLREKSIELSVLLLDADEHFVQEGSESLRRFPETIEALSRFQVVFFGDVDPNGGWLSSGQMNALLEFVGQRGGGFGLLAGERSAPYRFVGTPLERLVPVHIDPQPPSAAASASRGFRPELTEAGHESRVLRFYADPEANETVVASFPELFWKARTLGGKPGANVLLEDPLESTSSGPLPILVMARYGAGKIFFQATDDTWRWRRHTGELLYDGYWVRVMRELMNASFAAGNRRFVIRTDRRRYPYGASVRAQVELLDPGIAPEDQSAISLRLAPFGDASGTGSSGMELAAQRLGPRSVFFEANFVPASPGTYAVTVPEFSLFSESGDPSTVVTVEKPDLETKERDADPQMLARIAAKTGGKVLELDRLEGELGEIRDRSAQIPDDIVESLWDSRLVLVIFLLMISMEWGLRKAFGLL